MQVALGTTSANNITMGHDGHNKPHNWLAICSDSGWGSPVRCVGGLIHLNDMAPIAIAPIR